MAKRVASTSIKWSFIAETLLPQDQPKLSVLKSQCDKYLRQISSVPAELPKIDWNFYKAKISTPGMVDTFQKGYETLKIPYPSGRDALTATESKNKKMIEFAEKKYQELLKSIEIEKKKLKEIESVMKLSDMTLEELYLARPDFRIDNVNKPELWPQFLKAPGEEAQKNH